MIWRANRRDFEAAWAGRARTASADTVSGGFGRITGDGGPSAVVGMGWTAEAAQPFVAPAVRCRVGGRVAGGICQALGFTCGVGWMGSRAGFGEVGFRWSWFVRRAGGGWDYGAAADFVEPDGFVAWVGVVGQPQSAQSVLAFANHHAEGSRRPR